MSSIIRWRRGVMRRSLAERNWVKTTFILTQRKRGVSTLKRRVRDSRTTWKKVQQKLKLRDACKPQEGRCGTILPRSGLVQSALIDTKFELHSLGKAISQRCSRSGRGCSAKCLAATTPFPAPKEPHWPDPRGARSDHSIARNSNSFR